MIPTRRPVTTSALPAGFSRQQQERVARQIGAVLGEIDAERLGQLARARAEIAVGALAAPRPHRLELSGRLERPDQHRRRLALGLGDEVEQRVDAVGEVDVGAAGWAEEDLGAIGETDVGVAGGIVALVALGLDDDPAAAREEEPAADQLAGDQVNRAIEEISRKAALGRGPGSLTPALRAPLP